ncbi:hypothetical protein D3C79_683790 [compost metagenome]
MNLVVIEILQTQTVARQQTWHRVGRCHQQPFLTFDEVHRSGFTVDQIGQHLELVFMGPLITAQQHHRSAIGERCGVAGGEGALVATLEYRLEAGELLQGQVGAQVVVAGQAEKRREQIVMPALGIGRCHVLMTEQRQLILIRSGNLPGLRHQLAMLPHGQPRARLAIAWQLRLQVPWTQL